jgi:hypothetical protein
MAVRTLLIEVMKYLDLSIVMMAPELAMAVAPLAILTEESFVDLQIRS